ncbi:hypothetical protein BDZ97DRAFT_2061741 [Flammula alnicola]|nr:hypothetical protein BDZ97DRAFT_2061741 [Flammula alnicola]
MSSDWLRQTTNGGANSNIGWPDGPDSRPHAHAAQLRLNRHCHWPGFNQAWLTIRTSCVATLSGCHRWYLYLLWKATLASEEGCWMMDNTETDKVELHGSGYQVPKELEAMSRSRRCRAYARRRFEGEGRLLEFIFPINSILVQLDKKIHAVRSTGHRLVVLQVGNYGCPLDGPNIGMHNAPSGTISKFSSPVPTVDEELRNAVPFLQEDSIEEDLESGVPVGVGMRSKRRGFLAHGGAGGTPVFMGVGYVEGAEEDEDEQIGHASCPAEEP